MADSSFTVGTPYVRQITEQAFERDAAGAYAKEVELPGHLELVVDVNGAPWVIARRKAPGLLADMQRVNAQQSQAQASRTQEQQAQPEPQVPAEPQPQATGGGAAEWYDQQQQAQQPQGESQPAEQPQQPTG